MSELSFVEGKICICIRQAFYVFSFNLQPLKSVQLFTFILYTMAWKCTRMCACVLSCFSSVQFSSVCLLSRIRLFATPWITARPASLYITNSWSSLRLTPIESVMPSSHLILCRPLLLPSIPPSIRVFSNESTLCMRWPKYWSYLQLSKNYSCEQYHTFHLSLGCPPQRSVIWGTQKGQSQ